MVGTLMLHFDEDGLTEITLYQRYTPDQVIAHDERFQLVNRNMTGTAPAEMQDILRYISNISQDISQLCILQDLSQYIGWDDRCGVTYSINPHARKVFIPISDIEDHIFQTGLRQLADAYLLAEDEIDFGCLGYTTIPWGSFAG